MFRLAAAAAVLAGSVSGLGLLPLPVISQSWDSNTSFPEAWIASKLAAGQVITALTVSSGGEVVTVTGEPAQGNSISGQEYTTSAQWPASWIQTAWGSGYYVTELAYHPTGNWWAVVASQGAGIAGQAWDCDASIPQTWIDQHYSQGYVITSAQYGGGQWCVVMSKLTVSMKQNAWWSPAFPTPNITVGYNEGYMLTLLAFGGDMWFLVMSSDVMSTPGWQQLYFTNDASFPGARISQMWPKTYSKNAAGSYLTVVGTDASDNWFTVMTQFSNTYPASFDARVAWGASQTVLNQNQCGSCWAFSTSESFSDRLFISGVAAPEVIISPETLTSCSTYNEGCDGGWLQYAWQYLIDSGATTCTDGCTTGCDVYTSGNCVEGQDTAHDGCETCHAGYCTAGSAWPITYKASTYMNVNSQVMFIQSDLSTNGPVTTCFTVYSNFYTFFSAEPTGVYTQVNGTVVGGHCVLIVGWGVQSGTNIPYWLVKNSWSSSWGDNGFFRIQRGTNVGDFELGVVSGYGGSASTGMVSRSSTNPNDMVPLPHRQAFVSSSSVTSPTASGGMWIPRALSDADVADALLALQLPATDSEAVVSVSSQVVAGAKYRFSTQAGKLHHVHRDVNGVHHVL